MFNWKETYELLELNMILNLCIHQIDCFHGKIFLGENWFPVKLIYKYIYGIENKNSGLKLMQNADTI